MKGRSLAFLVLAALAAFTAPCRAEIIDKIVVVVNNEMITQGEVDRMLAPVYNQFKSAYQGDELLKRLDEARQAILGQLIEEKLMLGAAKKLNMEIEEKEVAGKIDEMQKRFGSREMFEQALAQQRMTVKDLKVKIREQLMVRKLIDQKVGAKVIITPVDVSEYYRKHADEFIQLEEVKVRCILIKEKEGLDAEKAADLADKIVTQLKGGTDFGDLARTYSEGPGASDGGFMGFKKKGDLLPEIESVVFSLKEGEASGVIRTSMGYFIFRVDERRQGKTMGFSEARRQIEDAIFRERAKDKMKGWLEGLKKHAYIAFK